MHVLCGNLGFDIDQSYLLILRSWRGIMWAAASRSITAGTTAVFNARNFGTTSVLDQVIKLTRFRVVDNSTIGRAAELAGKPAYCIHVYKKNGVGRLGDKVLVAIQGQKKRAYIVGLKQKQAPMVPRYDSNNIVLVEDNGTPTGTRIRAPVPSCLRGEKGDFTKILACATKFV